MDDNLPDSPNSLASVEGLEDIAAQDDLLLSSSPDGGDLFEPPKSGPDGMRISAFYDYKQERTLRETDAKLSFQQQLQHGGAQSTGFNSPLLRSTTWAGAPGLSRTGSVMSLSSLDHHGPKHLTSHFATPAMGPIREFQTGTLPPTGMASLEKPKHVGEVQIPSMGRFNPDAIPSDPAAQHGYAHRKPFQSCHDILFPVLTFQAM